MEKNIFENAYFGKAYKTRDCKKAVLISLSNFSALLSMELDMPGISSVTIPCGLDGKTRDKFLSMNQNTFRKKSMEKWYSVHWMNG